MLIMILFMFSTTFTSPSFATNTTLDEKEAIQSSQTYFSADTTRTFHGKILKSNASSHNYFLTFHVRDLDESVEEIRAVELRVDWKPFLVKKNTTTPSKNWFYMKVFELRRKGGKFPLDSKRICYSSSGKYTFEVTQAVKKWPGRKGTILVQLTPISLELWGKKLKFMPLGHVPRASLMVHTFDNFQAHLRAKREAKRLKSFRKRQRKVKNQKRNLCQLKTYVVDFDDLGWRNWIISPLNFTMNLCLGECPRHPIPDHFNTTNHAVVQALLHRVGFNGIPPPACAPIEFEDLTMLLRISKRLIDDAPRELQTFLDSGGGPIDSSLEDGDDVVVRVYKDMKATRCGCR